MNLNGLILSFPCALAASVLCCLLAFWLLPRIPGWHATIMHFTFWMFGLFGLELLLMMAVGPIGLLDHVGSFYSALHVTNFLLLPPASACFVLIPLLKIPYPAWALWVAAIAVCWVGFVGVLIINFAVHMIALHGDGSRLPLNPLL